MVAFGLTLKGFRWRWKRYVFLAGALSFCFAGILLLSGLAAGMTGNVNDAASRRYGGNLFVLGHQKVPYYTPVVRDQAALLAAVKAAGVDAALVARRTNLYENGLVFFNGYSARQKVVSGIDWAVESPVFKNLDFINGGCSGMEGSNGIIISNVTARELKARVGDDVLLEADTVTGQRNTMTLVVKGIFEDSSIFGAYTSYMDLSRLNGLIGLASDQYTILGIYLRHPREAARDSARLFAALSKRVPMFEPVRTQQELWTRLGETWTGVKYAVLTLDGYLSDIRDLTSAVEVAVAALTIMMLTITMVGISNTFRVIVNERIRELGTLRAIGMPKGAVARLILLEALLLSALGILAGSALGFSALLAVGGLRMPNIPGFDIFLQKGRIGWHLTLAPFLLDAASVVLAVVIGGMVPARRASSVEPAKALRIVE